MSPANAMIISAMPEEMDPFKELLSGYTMREIVSPIGDVIQASKGRSHLILIVTGIGMTATAASLGWALHRYEPRALVSIGSAGGLAADSRVGQVVIGAQYVNGGADGTAFGYAPGQVPGQPPAFKIGTILDSAARKFMDEASTDQKGIRWSSPSLQPTATAKANFNAGDLSLDNIRMGTMLSSDAFITEANVDRRRETFPDAITSDMESASAAQVAHAWGIPFVSVRAISDLCGHPDDQSVSFHAELETVARSAALTAIEILFRSEVLDVVRSSHGPVQHFNQVSLKGALYLMLSLSQNLKPLDTDELPEHVLDSMADHTACFPPEISEKYHGLIAAGFAHAIENPNASLTAKDYDALRFRVLENQIDDDHSNFVWPPTSQTIIKRFNGYWNDALSAIGLKPRRGRARGGLKFTERDYLYAVRSYVIYAEHGGHQPSFNGYGEWLDEAGHKGKLPSGAAIRQRFGSWKEALAAAAGFDEQE